MKKKFFVILSLTILLTSCGFDNSSKEKDHVSNSTEVKESNTKIEENSTKIEKDNSELESIKQEKDNETIEITLPSDFVDETTQGELDESIKDRLFISATLNQDGSATYVIAKSDHKKLMEYLRNEMNSSLNDMIGSKEYDTITDIKVNSDFTMFSITTKSTELSLEESLSILTFYLYGGIYNMFNGTPVDNVYVEFINVDSNEIIGEYNSADMNDSSEEPLQEDNTKDEDIETIKNEKLKVYDLGDTWVVDGQWALTINSVSLTNYRNEYSERKPAQVLIIDYTYENIGYEDENGIMDGLYLSLDTGKIIDSAGYMGYTYPGEIVNYPTEVPIGAKCKAQSCIGIDSESTQIEIILNEYDGEGIQHKAAFSIPLPIE